jgi:uncharacterized protein YndB with AHSA1/START domain
MPVKTQIVKFKRMVNAPPKEVYRAFTNSTALREWCCDVATTDPRKGGRFYVWWNSGYYASGEFTALTPDKKIAFLWHGRGEPGATRVQIAFAAKNGGTLVTLVHRGFGAGQKWAKVIKEAHAGWSQGLENLQSVLETGWDLRFVHRPMLGIGVDEFNASIAAKLGVPVTEGIRLGSVIEGMGAQAAGLQKDDVLVRLGRKKLTGYPTLVTALQPHHAGDEVAVVFYRGAEKKTVAMKLSGRPLPDVPPTAEGLAEAARKMYAELDAELAQCFAGVSEADAAHSPALGEWSAKETVAHLITGERDTHAAIADLIGGQERWADDYPGNIAARISVTVSMFPTVSALLEELARNEAGTVAMLAVLPSEFVARHGSYWRLGYNLLQTPEHTRQHMAQIRAAIAAAR